jgi:hypothetical protein
VNEKGEQVTITVAYSSQIEITITRDTTVGDAEVMSKLERAVLRNMLDPAQMIEGRARVVPATQQ